MHFWEMEKSLGKKKKDTGLKTKFISETGNRALALDLCAILNAIW